MRQDQHSMVALVHSPLTVGIARKLWDGGKTASEIGRTMGLSKNTITGIARRNEFEPRQSPIPLISEADIPKAAPTEREKNWFLSRLEKGTSERFVEFPTITPGMASLMLSYNHRNRIIRRSRVAQHVDRILRGDFILTSQGIAFAKTGVLNDGQHRLSAIVMANLPAPMMVTFGAEREEFAVLDQGAARTSSDLLYIHGGMKHTALRAAVARALFAVKTGNARPDTQQVSDYAVELASPQMDASLTWGHSMSKLLTPTGAALAHYWIQSKTAHPTRFSVFLDGLHSGDSITGVKHKLREWFLDRTDVKNGCHSKVSFGRQMHQAGVVINAWNAFVRHKKVLDKNWDYYTRLPDVL